MREPSLTIIQRGRADRWGKRKLYLRYSFNYDTHYISLTWKVKPEDWLPREQTVRARAAAGGTSPARINSDLSAKVSKAYDIVAELLSSNQTPDFETFRPLFVGEDRKMAAKDFGQLAKAVLDLELNSAQITASSHKAYLAAVRKMEKLTGKIPLHGITRMRVLQFKGAVAKEHNENMAAQYTRNVRVVYNKILKNWNLPDANKPFNSIEINIERMSGKKDLTEAEYQKLYTSMRSMPPDSDDFEVLRRFIFMCGGIRFSDTSLIQKELHYFEFSEGGETLQGITKPSKKTGEVGIIPVLPKDVDWLLRWKSSGLLFEPVAYEPYIKRLKKISKAIIGREITSHYGRHFAGDNIVNTHGLDLDDVKTILGISRNNTAEIYAKKKVEDVIRKYYRIVADKQKENP